MQRRHMLAGAAFGLTAGGLLRAAHAQPRNASWPRALNMGTAAPGGTYALYGPAWGQLVQEATGVNISYRTTQGPNQNIILVQRREVEIGMTTMGVALQAWNGQGAWTQGNKFNDIRALFPMYDTPFHGISLKRSGITQMSQLAGKNIGVGPRGGTPGTYFPLIMDALGYRPAAVRYGSGSDMSGQLQDGLLDAFLFASGVPIPAFSEAETQSEVNFLDYTAEEVAKLTRAFPELSAGTLPASTYRSAGRELRVVGMFNFAIGHKSLPEDLVYEMVKAVLGQNERLKQAIAAGSETLASNASKNSFLPYHPGAARYLREAGQTIPDNLVLA
ncbi:TAXI family TRAP transporter solute-binding subunit [Roseomonas terrae]|jgi:TRAP transporter TAXI family solute receptor|uniref:TAXI family TRAP transporter solute-binding subunit n=1 Tax=Neoroseomonas terrae TaxID=424799 RepID=A0ABS5EJA0_9PROT|nr:TAXI family TRAP transporter solute-binding subunit [Neoroseomonas terrae]MBR0651103.1 TAXI family TRAP transporter solute-binding subunit [Neoroseomonas terrae]